MGKYVDLTGMKFGRLTVLERVEDYIRKNGKPRARWLCECECGNKKITLGENLTRHLTESCGCLQKERVSKASKKHGDADSRLYNVWRTMKDRCRNPNSKSYRLYGGRGINMCDEWYNNYAIFQEWALQNGYRYDASRGECTIDRIDNDKGYNPDNCRFISQREQMNNVSYNHRITYNNETHTIAEWARIYDMPYCRLSQRINKYGYSIEDALNKTN